MAFVHGHPRDLGWVRAHLRRPNEAEEGQLPLLAVVEEPDGDDAVEPAVPPPAEREPR